MSKKIWTYASKTAHWEYEIGTVGRGIRICGPVYVVVADSLRDAIRHLRKRHVTRAWTLTLNRYPEITSGSRFLREHFSTPDRPPAPLAANAGVGV